MARHASTRPATLRPATLFAAALGTLAFTVTALLAAPPAHAQVDLVSAGGTALYAHDSTVKTGSANGVSYNADTRTLTLSSAKLSGSDAVIDIQASPDEVVTIQLKGANTLTVRNAGGIGIRAACALSFKGGTLAIGGGASGIEAEEVHIASGTFNIRRFTKAGICGRRGVWVYKGTGKISAVGASSAAGSIVSTRGLVSTVPKRLGSIKGRLGTGARFLMADSLYRVSAAGAIALESYGGGRTAALTAKKYGSCTYRVTGIDAKAFATSKGAKVTKITLGAYVERIGKQAFTGTAKLTNLDIKSWYTRLVGKNKPSIAAKAFSGCGKKSGTKLNVHTGRKSPLIRLKVKFALVKKGLSLSAKVSA